MEGGGRGGRRRVVTQKGGGGRDTCEGSDKPLFSPSPRRTHTEKRLETAYQMSPSSFLEVDLEWSASRWDDEQIDK